MLNPNILKSSFIDTNGYFNKSKYLMTKYKDLDFVQRATIPEKQKMQIPDIDNPNGFMSHKMSYMNMDGQNYAYPEVVNINGKLRYIGGKEAMEYAVKNKQLIPLGTDNEFAEYFTTTGYKYMFPKEDYEQSKKEYDYNYQQKLNRYKYIPNNIKY